MRWIIILTMSWQTLSSAIRIGNFKFSGIHEVRITKSIHTLNDAATIQLPTIAYYIPTGSSTPVRVVTGELPDFEDGSPVQIDLGYNGNLNSEFTGFVKRRGTGMPLVLECEGYVRQLRNNKNITYDCTKTATTAAKLLALACQGTDVTVSCPVDFPIKGVKFVKANGVQICDAIKDISAGCLTIFFITPKTLWCGLAYTAYAGGNNPFGIDYQVDYRLGYNCMRQNGLKERVPSEPVQIFFKGKYATGALLYNASKEKAAKNKVTHLSSQIPDNVTMGKFAQEKAYAHNYIGYEGTLTGFLEPYAYAGMNCNIVNAEYADLNGIYLTEATDVRFGVSGARSVITIGPKLNYGNTTAYNQLNG